MCRDVETWAPRMLAGRLPLAAAARRLPRSERSELLVSPRLPHYTDVSTTAQNGSRNKHQFNTNVRLTRNAVESPPRRLLQQNQKRGDMGPNSREFWRAKTRLDG